MTSTSFNVGLGEVPRMSSRVLRPPGGGHTDIFGGDPEPPRGRRQFPGQTNAEDEKTSTSLNVGHGEEPRMSSRVQRGPGGGHSDIFGGDPEPPRGRRLFPGQVNAGQGDEPLKAQNGISPTQNGQETPQQEVAAAPETSPAKPESPAKTQPEPVHETTPVEPKAESPKVESPKVEPPKVEPPKRVRVPPGGFSSGLW